MKPFVSSTRPIAASISGRRAEFCSLRS